MMAKNQKISRDKQDKADMEKMQKRVENLLPPKADIPASISIQQAEELKGRINELEAILAQQTLSNVKTDPIIEEREIQPFPRKPVSVDQPKTARPAMLEARTNRGNTFTSFSQSPLRIILVIAASTFAAELLIMFVFLLLPSFAPLAEALIELDGIGTGHLTRALLVWLSPAGRGNRRASSHQR